MEKERAQHCFPEKKKSNRKTSLKGDLGIQMQGQFCAASSDMPVGK